MIHIDTDSLHPDLQYRDKYQFILKSHILQELEELELTSTEPNSAAEQYYIEQRKLELFRRIFGF